MSGGSGGGSIDIQSTLNELINNGQVGVIIDTPQAPQVQPEVQPDVQPGVQPQPVEQKVEQKVEQPKTKKRKLLNVTKKQRQRKAKLRGEDKIVFRGRLIADPQYQNLRTEAERLNQAPILLEFKSTKKNTEAPTFRRLM